LARHTTHFGRRRFDFLLLLLLAADDLVKSDLVKSDFERSLPSEDNFGFVSCDGKLARGRGGAGTGEDNEEASAVFGALCV